MLAGAVDPIEGSAIILPGSALFALGTYVGHAERWIIVYRVWVFILIAVGVGALWWLSSVGGFGGTSEYSAWWGLLVLPYPIGWWMGICGPGSPRWMLWPGIVVGLWYLGLLALALRVGRHVSTNVLMGALGVLTIGGSVYRLRRSATEELTAA
jgi:hypothetical protein